MLLTSTGSDFVVYMRYGMKITVPNHNLCDRLFDMHVRVLNVMIYQCYQCPFLLHSIYGLLFLHFCPPAIGVRGTMDLPICPLVCSPIRSPVRPLCLWYVHACWIFADVLMNISSDFPHPDLPDSRRCTSIDVLFTSEVFLFSFGTVDLLVWVPICKMTGSQ